MASSDVPDLAEAAIRQKRQKEYTAKCNEHLKYYNHCKHTLYE